MLGLNIVGGAARIPLFARSRAIASATNAVRFDGTNDHLQLAAGLGPMADSPKALCSLWFDFKGGDGVTQFILDGVGGRLRMTKEVGDHITIEVEKANNTAIWKVTSTLAFTTAVNVGWHHLLWACDLHVPSADVFLDDALMAHTENTAPISETIDLSIAGPWAFGSLPTNGNLKCNADFAEPYLAVGETLDINSEDNRRKFIDGDGKPVDLGADGSTPTGNQPVLFLTGATADWHTNKGDGGGFTENGALTDGASDPEL